MLGGYGRLMVTTRYALMLKNQDVIGCFPHLALTLVNVSIENTPMKMSESTKGTVYQMNDLIREDENRVRGKKNFKN